MVLTSRLSRLGRLSFPGALLLALCANDMGCEPGEADNVTVRNTVVLPVPSVEGGLALDTALARRRSMRTFSSESLTTDQVGMIAWAGQGLTDRAGYRTAPSAGALYPLEIYLLQADGVFRYVPLGHKLEQLDLPDRRGVLAEAALGQSQVREAPLVVVIVAVVAKTRAKYGDRAERYVTLEAGHVAQNMLLEAVSLGLGAVPVGAFEDEDVRETLRLSAGHFPLYILCFGRAM